MNTPTREQLAAVIERITTEETYPCPECGYLRYHLDEGRDIATAAVSCAPCVEWHGRTDAEDAADAVLALFSETPEPQRSGGAGMSAMSEERRAEIEAVVDALDALRTADIDFHPTTGDEAIWSCTIGGAFPHAVTRGSGTATRVGSGGLRPASGLREHRNERQARACSVPVGLRPPRIALRLRGPRVGRLAGSDRCAVVRRVRADPPKPLDGLPRTRVRRG